MDKLICYEHIAKSMTSSKQEIVQTFAHWDGKLINDDYVNIRFKGGLVVTIHKSNIKGVYSKTENIYRLLYD